MARILFVIDRYYFPEAFGGVESSTHDLCEALIARGHDCAVLCRLWARGGVYMRNRLKHKLLGVQTPRDRVARHGVYRSFDVDAALPGVVRRFAPSSIIVNQVGRFARLAARAARTGVPSFIYFRDNEMRDVSPSLRSLDTIGFIANSRFTAEAARSMHGVESTIAPPLVLPERCRAPAHDGQYVTHIGISEKKGVWHSIELARHLDHVPFLFVESWAGVDDTARQAIRELANCTYWKPVRDVRRIYERSHVLLVPSRWNEAWGRVVTEAQLNGIPVVASDRGGLPESVGEGGSCVDLDNDGRALEAAVLRLVREPDHHARMASKARRRVQRADIEPDALLGRLERLLG